MFNSAFCYFSLKHARDDMNDLDIAKKRLQTKDLTLVIVKNSKIIFKTTETGIKGFLKAIEESENSLENASIADKVVGKAIALLCIYSKVSAVYAKVLSKKAKNILKKHKIDHEWSLLVDEILDFKKNQTCPFEMKAKNILDPTIGYFELKNLLKKLKNCE